MKRHLWIILICAALCDCDCFAQATNQTLSDLQNRIAAHIDQSRFAQAQWGIKIVSLDSGKTLFERNANKLMKPASNTKMYTAALALDRLGEDYRIKTSFYAHSKPDPDGTLKGPLVVYGRGDPSFSSRFCDGNYDAALAPAVDAIVAAGVKRIDGGLVGDESYFSGPPFGNEWTWDDLQEYYGASVSALTYQDNVIDLQFNPGNAVGDPCQIVTLPETTYMIFSNRTTTTASEGRAHFQIYRPLAQNVTYVHGQAPLEAKTQTDAVSVDNPALWFVTMLKQALVKRGVEITGDLRTRNWLDEEASPCDYSKWAEIATVASRPIAEIVKRTLKPSQNLYAQLLFLQAARVSEDRKGQAAGNSGSRRRRRGETTEEIGLSEMGKFMGQAGIAPGDVLLDEGSGLSRTCLLTPAASVQLLTFMSHHRAHFAFVDGFPIAGVDGSLKNRFKGTSASGNARAKTGTLRFVNTISGYVTSKAGENLVFSIMLNNYDPRHREGGEEGPPPDAIIEMLAEFDGKGEIPK
jgi:D-alanyl-D-alanine carboxypeptidase/D-alanyl-D-alanine-endopeptidase (penicillin-binding protein 4)